MSPEYKLQLVRLGILLGRPTEWKHVDPTSFIDPQISALVGFLKREHETNVDNGARIQLVAFLKSLGVTLGEGEKSIEAIHAQGVVDAEYERKKVFARRHLTGALGDKVAFNKHWDSEAEKLLKDRT